MNLIIARMRALLRNDSGQDLLEYALLVALISLAAVVAIGTTGDGVNTIFGQITTELGAAVP
jgi:pilus assembly protein Flp/PilA